MLIDIALMEKQISDLFSLKAGWDDIGSWKSVWNNSKKDFKGNALKGRVIIEDSENCYLRSEDRLIVGINITDLVIVETNDAVLVSKKDSTQKVKQILKKLKKNNFREAEDNKKIYRPWGNFTRIEEGLTWQVKKLEINPKKVFIQMHKKDQSIG